MIYNYNKLTPFKKYIIQNFPFIDADFDALTNYQLYCKIVEYLNKVIDSENGQNEQIELLTNAFNNLHDYVENYFANLDVQEEIDNKLDDMVEAGTLQEIIADYLNSKAVFGYDNVASMKAATNLIDGSYAKTLGFYSVNDGGGATYKIRNITNDDVVDESTIISMENNDLIAELIIDDKINVLQLGAKADGNYDNTSIFQKGIELAYQLTKPLYIPSGKNNRYILRNSLSVNFTNDADALTIYGDLYQTNNSGTWTRYTTILCYNDFLVGINENLNLTMYNLSIGFQDNTLVNPDNNSFAIFKNIIFKPLNLRHCYFASVGYFLYNSTYTYVSDIYNNNFYGINNAWIKTYSDGTPSSQTRHLLSDSNCHNNYIHGNRHTNPVLIDGACDDDSKFKDNFVDFFKFLFINNIPNVIIAQYGIINNNIFSRCFRITNRVISATFIENNFQAWNRTTLNNDFDNQDSFMQSAKVGAFICDPVDKTLDNNFNEEYRNTKLINNKLYGNMDYFVWFSGTPSTSGSFMKNFYEKGTIPLPEDADTYESKLNDKYFYVKALSTAAMVNNFKWNIESLNYLDLSNDYQTAPNNAVATLTYNGTSYFYFIVRNNQYIWLGDGLYIGKLDSSKSGHDRFTLVKVS